LRRLTRGRVLAVALAGVVVLAALGWAAARQIRSPAQVAAGTAAPQPSLITAPVERRTLSTEVIVRGTVRYGSPQAVVLPTSGLKTGSELVSRGPRRGARLREGSVALSVSGRPVFVLQGAEPAHRDLGPGARGPDVLQLERALARMGFPAGAKDGRYDGATAAALAALYRRKGWTPFGATDAQSDQLRSAEAAADGARDALLQTRLALRTAARGATPAEVNQARVDVVTAKDALDAAALAVIAAQVRIDAANDARARALDAERTAGVGSQRDVSAADAEVATRRAGLNVAVDAQADAQRRLDQAPAETTPSERESLRAALRQASDAVGVARASLAAAEAAGAAARAAGPAAAEQARADERTAERDARVAAAELRRARRSVETARSQARLSRARVKILTWRTDTTVEQQIVGSAQAAAQRTRADVSRLALRAGIQLPADEVLFFPALPLRVDSVKAKRGDPVSGRVMTVSNSRLAIDSSLSLGDAKLVRPGMPVQIEEQDLGVKITGTVRQVADKPGTNAVDPARIYLEISPKNAPPVLVGASVKLAIAVKNTRGSVLAVPVSALSVVADGTSRVQRDLGGGRTRFITVVPGLAAAGLVEVRPVGAKLRRGHLVVVGAGGAAAPAAGAAPPPATTATGAVSPPTSSTGTTATPSATSKANGP